MITAIQERLDLTLTELKAFLRVQHAEEDTLLQSILDAAKLQADHFCQNTFKTIDEETEEEVLHPIPDDVKHAVKMIAATLYEQRTDHKAGESMQGYSYSTGQSHWQAERLLHPYRRFFAC